eukprot:5345489-Ditylum_brightwellii.AAC.1
MKGIDFHVKDVKDQTKKEYLSRLRKILKSGMNGGNIMTAICAYAVQVLHYTFGIMKWTKGELKNMDVKTRKLLMTHGFLHPKASTHRLYLHCSRGGRGLTGLEDNHNTECSALAKYVVKSDDPLRAVVRETTSLTQKFLMKFASAPKCTTPDLMDEQHAYELCAKPLHDKFFCKQAAIPQVNLERSLH